VWNELLLLGFLQINRGDASSDEEDVASPDDNDKTDITKKLQTALLEYLLVNGQKDPALLVG
jgi:hypothetical protein